MLIYSLLRVVLIVLICKWFVVCCVLRLVYVLTVCWVLLNLVHLEFGMF